METCSYCGNKTELGSLDPIQDLYYPNLYNYQCKKCSQFNRIHTRKSFIDPMFLKNFNPKKQRFEEAVKKQEPIMERNYDFLTSETIIANSPFKNALKQMEDQNKRTLIVNPQSNNSLLERGFKKRHPIARTWGSTRIHCTHPTIVTKNGITYCTACGQNLKDTKLEKLGIHDPSIPEFGPLDRTIDDIFAQEPEMIALQENRGRGRPRLNPFVYSNELLPNAPILAQPSLLEMKRVSPRVEKSVNDVMTELFG